MLTTTAVAGFRWLSFGRLGWWAWVREVCFHAQVGGPPHPWAEGKGRWRRGPKRRAPAADAQAYPCRSRRDHSRPARPRSDASATWDCATTRRRSRTTSVTFLSSLAGLSSTVLQMNVSGTS